MDTLTRTPIPFRRAQRIAAIQVSEILRIGALATERRKQGRPMIILGAGEPDFDTPDHIREAAIRAIRAGQTRYTALDGTPELNLFTYHFDLAGPIVDNCAGMLLDAVRLAVAIASAPLGGS